MPTEMIMYLKLHLLTQASLFIFSSPCGHMIYILRHLIMGSVNPTYLSTIVMRKKGKPQFHAYLQMLIFLSEEMDSLFNSFKTYF